MTLLETIYQRYLEQPTICTDSRKIEPGSIFFALKGESFNGNHFAPEAIEKGASLAIVDEPPPLHSEKYFQVPDSLKFLQDLAALHRSNLTATFIGITGSNGKTTTKELTNKVLASTYKTFSTPGNLNNQIGVPLTILGVNRDTDFVIVEMGANHPGEIASLCHIARPGFGLVTNIGKAHLEGFGGLEGVIRAKSELYEYLRTKNGKVFLHMDDPILTRQARGIEQITYGTGGGTYCQGRIISCSPFLEMEWSCQGNRNELSSSLYGLYNFPNIMAAICIGKCFGVGDENINLAINSYEPDNNRSQFTTSLNGNTLILDAYNANPTSMESAIRNFHSLPGKEKILILGDMLELGAEGLAEHLAIIRLINELGFHEVFLAGDIFNSLQVPANWKKFPDVALLREWLKAYPIRDRAILLKGSRKIRLETLTEIL